MKKLILLVSALFASCTSAPLSARDQARERFLQSSAIWSEKTPSRARAAAEEFTRGAKLPNGKPYGVSMKHVHIHGKTILEIEAELNAEGCRKIGDFIRDPKTKEPALCHEKKTAQVIFDCPDGGMVRLKPEGDPCAKFRRQPHAVKAVRDPYNASVSDFSKEAFKVDEDGRAIPKSPADLAPAVRADDWAEDAHSDLP